MRLIKEKHFPAAFKCYYNFHKIDSISSDNLHLKMVIHVHSDSTFRRYQKEMRSVPIAFLFSLRSSVCFTLSSSSSSFREFF